MKYERLKPKEINFDGMLNLYAAVMHEAYQEYVLALKSKDHDAIRESEKFILGERGQMFSLGKGERIIERARKEANYV